MKITDESISKLVDRNSNQFSKELNNPSLSKISSSTELMKEIIQQVPTVSHPDMKINSEKLQNIVHIQQSTQVLHEKPVFNLNSAHSAHDLKCLMNDHDLSRVLNKNPWEVNIKKTLADLQNRLYENAYIKFRIGGKAIYSASQIVRAKSFLMIEESQQTEDAFNINESDAEDLGVSEENVLLPDNSIQISEAEVIANLKTIGETDENSTMANLAGINNICDSSDSALNFGAAFAELATENPDLAMESVIPTIRDYEVDAQGNRFLKEPDREVFRKITFQDLGKALFKTLSYQIHGSGKIKKSVGSIDDCIPQILPENIMKKAEEERALVEFQIGKMYDNILQFYQNQIPVSFLKVIINESADGIVRTLLYLLHLANRKKIELWQKIPESEENSNGKSSSKKKSHAQIPSEITNFNPTKEQENTGSDIFITPILTCPPTSSI